MTGFTDLEPDAWYHNGVHWALDNGVMNGVGNGKFEPGTSTSRAMIVTMIWRMEGQPEYHGMLEFTDVDDKIIKRANEEGISSSEVAEKYIKEFWTDAHGLNFKDASVHPKATENIDEIIDIIKTLVDKGYAYAVDGDVYYRALKARE